MGPPRFAESVITSLVVAFLLLAAGPPGVGTAGAHEVGPCELHSASAVTGSAPGEIDVRAELGNDSQIQQVLVYRDGQLVGKMVEPGLEVGTVQLSDSIDGGVVATVSLSHSFDDPVVSAYVATRNGGESIDVRVDNVQSSSFDVFMEEPDDEPHVGETVGYVVAESGVHETLDGDLRVEAGTVQTDVVHRSPDPFPGVRVDFEQAFDDTPAVLTTLNSYNNSAFMSTVVTDRDNVGFNVSQEAGSTGSPAAVEEIGWIALSTGSGSVNGTDFLVGHAPEDGDLDGVDDSPESISYSFGAAPALAVQGATGNGLDGYWARGAGVYDASGATVFAEEDQVEDAERSHADEAFDFAAFSPAGVIPMTAAGDAAPAPYDLAFVDDGLGDGEVHQYELVPVCPSGQGPTAGPLQADTQSVPSEPRDLVAVNVPEDGQGDVCGPQFDEHAEVKLTWDAPEDRGGDDLHIDEYVVYRGPNASALAPIAAFDPVDDENQRQGDGYFYDCGVADGDTVVYAVSAVNVIGEGPLSDDVLLSVIDLPGSTSAPDAEADGPTSVRVEWTPPAHDGHAPITEYRVLRGSAGEAMEVIGTVDGSTTSFVDDRALPTETYRYAIQAVNRLGAGPVSAADCGASLATTALGLTSCDS